MILDLVQIRSLTRCQNVQIRIHVHFSVSALWSVSASPSLVNIESRLMDRTKRHDVTGVRFLSIF